MSEPITRDEFNAHMGVLQENDRETRADIKELTGAVKTLVVTQTESIAEHRHSRKEIDSARAEISEIKKGQVKFQDAIGPRVRALEIQNSNNRLRWAFLASVTTIIIGLSTWTYTTFSKPEIENSKILERMSGDMQSIRETMDINYNAAKAKAIAEKNHVIGE